VNRGTSRELNRALDGELNGELDGELDRGLSIDGVTAGYGSLPVVHDVSIDVARGEVVCLLGPNGAGKTTTLLAAVGQLPLTAGRVIAAGRAVDHRRASRAAAFGVAFVPDDRGLFLPLTVAENLRLVHPWRQTLAEVFDVFPALAPLMKRRAGLLSGGEQQMVALAKAVLFGPRVLLIDEMSHGLAPLVSERLLRMVGELARRHGTAVLLVEQMVDVALSVSDRAYVMRQGRIVMEGSSADVSERRELVEAHYLGAVAR
jgi:branched-chain amino acid transport system ATP-binding protein